jgi:hypothetical protein
VTAPRETPARRRGTPGLKSAADERDCAARYLHSWAMALSGRGWTAPMLERRLFELAREIRAGAHVVDPDGDAVRASAPEDR